MNPAAWLVSTRDKRGEPEEAHGSASSELLQGDEAAERVRVYRDSCYWHLPSQRQKLQLRIFLSLALNCSLSLSLFFLIDCFGFMHGRRATWLVIKFLNLTRWMQVSLEMNIFLVSCFFFVQSCNFQDSKFFWPVSGLVFDLGCELEFEI